ncbi:hypothetical protein BKD30_08785 [Tersicoccus phoenicis]|uniref:Lipoprotein n=1 Tax=Tersicoccus phoenicis TaxID=554083 RepID=A0A1R1LA04_9MICC|nr:hypothetical protein [Tersicoccus phoenicis]OMH24356.1 hypothetical protein BKD30_08785 [Tersicoccus phoenicis]
MRIRSAICAVIAATAIISSTGCSAGPSAAEGPQGDTIQLHASWAKGYPTLKQLVADSDAIVRGAFAGQKTTQVDGLPYTDTTFVVSQWIKGSSVGGNEIVVRQTGGQMDGKQYVVESDPLAKPGDQALLYLEKTPGDIYAALGGPTGRLAVQRDGSVAKLKGTSLTEPLPSSITNLVQTTKKTVASQRTK